MLPVIEKVRNFMWNVVGPPYPQACHQRFQLAAFRPDTKYLEIEEINL